MGAYETLRPLIDANRAIIARAKELNGRAGTNVFPVPTRDELTGWLLERLQGARRASEVGNQQLITLPALDPMAVDRVLAENPDTITVLGPEDVYNVVYRTGYVPRIVWLKSTDANWERIPDAGVFLPGGRQVEVEISFGWNASFVDIDIPSLKGKVRAHLNRAQWDQWVKPEIPLPDLVDDEAVIPLETVQYGTCQVTGQPLMAYGTLKRHQYADYAGYPKFVVFWTTDVIEVQQKADNAARLLVENRIGLKVEAERQAREEAEKAELAVKVEEGRALKAELEDRLGVSYDEWYALGGLKSEIYSHANYSWHNAPYSLQTMQEWMARAMELKAQALAELARIRKEREEAERAAAEAEATERAEFAPILQVVGEDARLDWLREIRTFAQDVDKIVGRRNAINGLRQELEANYGYVRRQDAVRYGVNGIEHTEGGARFLSLHRLCDVNAMLAGAVAWLEAKQGTSRAAEPVVVVDSPKVEVAAIDFSGLFNKGAKVKRAR